MDNNKTLSDHYISSLIFLARKELIFDGEVDFNYDEWVNRVNDHEEPSYHFAVEVGRVLHAREVLDQLGIDWKPKNRVIDKLINEYTASIVENGDARGSLTEFYKELKVLYSNKLREILTYEMDETFAKNVLEEIEDIL